MGARRSSDRPRLSGLSPISPWNTKHIEVIHCQERMSDAWDADDFEPPAAGSVGAKVAVTDKWEGEDEEDDAKIALREAAEAQADETELTPEEKASEKLRALKMEENAQMSLTRDMLGIQSGEIDNMI